MYTKFWTSPSGAVLEVLEVISRAERRRINELTLHQDEALGPSKTALNEKGLHS